MKVKKIILRLLTTIILILGLFFAPWIIVFAGAIAAAAVFYWYLELFVIGFLASSISGFYFWKMFLILASILLFEEWLKTKLKAEDFFVRFWLGTAGTAAFILLLFGFV